MRGRQDVAKFASVLELNGIPISRGLFITNSTYVPRATTLGIKTVDGKQLAQLERRAKWAFLWRNSYRAALLAVVLAGATEPLWRRLWPRRAR